MPCGKCPQCLANYRAELISRLKVENFNSSFSLFVTLTYDDNNLFFNNKGVASVCKRDVQLFFKRLRKKLGNKSFRYFLTSEYGDHTKRPHYHALLFFAIPRDASIYDKITECWGKGFCDFGEVETGSITYCTKYCLKKTAPPPEGDKCFRLFSMRPGLGAAYLTNEMINYHITQNTKFSFYGDTSRLPRYFKNKVNAHIENVMPCILDMRKQERYERQKEMYVDFNNDFADFKKSHPDYSEVECQVRFMRMQREKKQREGELINKHTQKQKL